MRISHLTVSAALLAATACTGEPLGERTIEMTLGYEDSTNWGPMDATGTATIDTRTGQVDITVAGLPALTDDAYEGWLAGGGEDATSTGVFNTDANGAGGSTIVLGDLTEATFERVVITVEPVPDPSPSPDSRHTIGGDIPPAE